MLFGFCRVKLRTHCLPGKPSSFASSRCSSGSSHRSQAFLEIKFDTLVRRIRHLSRLKTTSRFLCWPILIRPTADSQTRKRLVTLKWPRPRAPSLSSLPSPAGTTSLRHAQHAHAKITASLSSSVRSTALLDLTDSNCPRDPVVDHLAKSDAAARCFSGLRSVSSKRR